MSLIDLNNIQRMLDSFYSKIKNNFAPKNHGTHLTLGISNATAFRGDYGNTAYNHSQAPHAPSNAQKNSDITKAEIEAKLTGAITSHSHNSYVNQNAFSNFTVGSTTISADSTTDTLTIVAGSNITLTPDATNDKLTIAATNTTYSTGNASTAGLTKLYTSTGTATDGTMTQAAINTAINTAITSMSGNAGTATKLATARKINGTSFDGSADITTANWGTARNITISDSVGVNTGTAVSVNGSVNINLKLPATISASLSGNATTATTLATARTINGTSFNGAGNITTANWGTARTITIGGSSKSVNGSANVSWTLAEIGAAKESHGTHVSYGGNGSAATVSRSDHTHKYAGSSSAGGTANSVNGFTFWSGTQSQYDSIATKSSTTVYMIKD